MNFNEILSSLLVGIFLPFLLKLNWNLSSKLLVIMS